MANHFPKLGFFLLILFSLASSLGSFNPFGSFHISDMDSSSSQFTLISQGLFIGYLLFYRGANRFMSRELLLLISFVVVWTLSLLLFSYDIALSYWMLLFKIVLCIILFYKLPFMLNDHPRYVGWSLLAFSIGASTIATLFMTGFLDPYVFWSKGRAFIFMENSNSTSTRMAFALLFIFYFIVENPLSWTKKRFALIILCFPLFYTIMASGSRGSFIVAILCLAIYLWFLPSKNKITKFAFILICSIGVVYLIMQIAEQNSGFSLIDRLADSIETGNDSGRTELSDAARDIFLKNPFLGVGADEFTNLMRSDYGFTHTVHNNYWYVLATSGLIGFMFYGLFILFLLVKAIMNIKRVPFSLVLIIGMLLIGAKTGGAIAYVLFWYVFAIGAGLLMIKKAL